MPFACSTGSSSLPKNAINRKKYKVEAIVLLLILIPGVMLSSLKTINPWLSGCDISHPLLPEMQGTCSSANPRLSQKKQQQAGVLPCPKSCPLNQSTSSQPQCLAYLDDSRKNAICNFSSSTRREWLISFLGQIRLRHCCEHKVVESLAGPLLDKVLRGKDECFKVIDNLVNVDNLAARVSCEFNEVLSRFDCSHSYSVRFSCEHCKEAYRRWVCTSLVPYFKGTLRIRPCRSICQVVEQKCPYFLPENRAPSLPTQYAGEPAFLCTDPNIPESAEQQLRSIHPPDGSCCVKPCGAPYDGNCIQPGVGCDGKSGHENVTNEDCNGLDGNSFRGSSDRCPGPSVHPRSKASLPVITSYPVLALSTFLTLRASHSHRHILLLLLVFLFLRSSSLGVLQLMAVLCFAPLAPITSLLEIDASYHLIKISQSILNYFKSLCDGGQYYSIPISVNFRTGGFLVSGSPPPLPLPIRGRHQRVIRGYIRGHCKRHCIQILSMGTQELMRRNLCGLTQEDGNLLSDCLGTGTLTKGERGILVEWNVPTISGVKVYSETILKTVPLKIVRFSLSRESREVRNAFIKRLTKVNHIPSYLSDRLTPILINNPYIRVNVVCKIVLMFLHGLTSYKYVCYLFKKYSIDKRYREKKKVEVGQRDGGCRFGRRQSEHPTSGHRAPPSRKTSSFRGGIFA